MLQKCNVNKNLELQQTKEQGKCEHYENPISKKKEALKALDITH